MIVIVLVWGGRRPPAVVTQQAPEMFGFQSVLAAAWRLLASLS